MALVNDSNLTHTQRILWRGILEKALGYFTHAVMIDVKHNHLTAFYYVCFEDWYNACCQIVRVSEEDVFRVTNGVKIG